jgi:hypothetical protein
MELPGAAVTPAQPPAGGQPALPAVDAFPRWLVREDSGESFRALGEWLCAYQRVTHYLRVLNVWDPPPHLLARTVLERAVRRAGGDRAVMVPVGLAMEELHMLLQEQDGDRRDTQDPYVILTGSASWRTGAWLAADGKRIAVRADTAGAETLTERAEGQRPLLAPSPASMVPQPFDLYSARRLLRACADKVQRLRLGIRWKRRHA